MDRKQVLAVCGGSLVAVAAASYAFVGGKGEASRNAVPVSKQAAVVARTKAKAVLAPPAIAPPGLDAARPSDCLIEPSAVVRVNSGVEGVIQAIYVDRGDRVNAGQVVAQLRADVDRAGAAAAQARANNVHSERAAASRAAYLESVNQRSQKISEFLARDSVEEAQANARAAQEERLAAAQNRRVAELESVQTQRIMGEKTVDRKSVV